MVGESAEARHRRHSSRCRKACLKSAAGPPGLPSSQPSSPVRENRSKCLQKRRGTKRAPPMPARRKKLMGFWGASAARSLRPGDRLGDGPPRLLLADLHVADGRHRFAVRVGLREDGFLAGEDGVVERPFLANEVVARCGELPFLRGNASSAFAGARLNLIQHAADAFRRSTDAIRWPSFAIRRLADVIGRPAEAIGAGSGARPTRSACSPNKSDGPAMRVAGASAPPISPRAGRWYRQLGCIAPSGRFTWLSAAGSGRKCCGARGGPCSQETSPPQSGVRACSSRRGRSPSPQPI